jgi:translation initiation factor 3 subunit E
VVDALGKHIDSNCMQQTISSLLFFLKALFIWINQRDGADALIDFFTEPSYLQTIENLCPWLLRYYAAFVVLSPLKRKNNLPNLLNELNAMSYLYSDPMTEFLRSLYDHFDFNEAQLKLKECQKLMKSDFFLQLFADHFMAEARILICEMYCAINRQVDLTLLSGEHIEMIGMSWLKESFSVCA